MIRAYEADVIRVAEEPLLAATRPDELMKLAAFAVATEVLRELARRGERRSGSTALLLVGGGDNGGDALYAGATLARRGLQVTAALMTDRAHPRGLAAARAAGVRVETVHGPGPLLAQLADRAGVWVDGLTGIGARGGLREPLAGIVTALAERRTGMPDEPLVVAVDVPSGIGVDDGTVPGPVLRADVTVTMGGAKPGLLAGPAAELAGRVEVVDIGLQLGTPRLSRLTPADATDVLVAPAAQDHKYTRGVLGVVAGSTAYPGAAVLAVAGALGAGLGMVRYLGPGPVTRLVHARFPEVVPAAGRVQAWTVGSGVDPDDEDRAAEVRHTLAQAADEGVPAVVDAGGLALLPRQVPAGWVLTPHAGELAILLSGRGRPTERQDVEAHPLRHACEAARLTGAVVLLKGAVTVVAAPDGETYAQADGSPWLATAGTGDVLAGVLGAVLAGAGHATTAHLAAAGALLHGRAGVRAARSGPVTALQVAEALPGVVGEILA